MDAFSIVLLILAVILFTANCLVSALSLYLQVKINPAIGEVVKRTITLGHKCRTLDMSDEAVMERDRKKYEEDYNKALSRGGSHE